ncbi:MULTISPECIES: hypothetical protein [Nostoc]|uniref:Uncharacterized protein n=1 Tax=Nostoc paludosum FACHB-159 TaxID=2692908 RepID=A0ABR8KLZ4_9NOSO|nr:MULTISPECIES: hypothetical protein [Nostoc]MBD2683654.1 hypothetical protein [Nostoc sp. FACHB-857]MBD2739975.1 hypothetical protein [Nostoc paludosum FACHB-159]
MEPLNQNSRYQEWKKLREAGHNYRTAYTLSSDNPLATHNKLEKLKKNIYNYINSGKKDESSPIHQKLKRIQERNSKYLQENRESMNNIPEEYRNPYYIFGMDLTELLSDSQ